MSPTPALRNANVSFAQRHASTGCAAWPLQHHPSAHANAVHARGGEGSAYMRRGTSGGGLAHRHCSALPPAVTGASGGAVEGWLTLIPRDS
eukprot:CAMPEP_0118880768 /NCGR_PEP_ID=MMETSP1163-20130328/20312_1 /TAXON_ID=124430 /ORGANISM="Phaeomonas parva, Strain CCMP2877" /LENGTH=90 /DNA_ID=CAMNT_0006817305 /DNA_START=63 /DNA_END=336 /DNA_ORIENTATION=+